MYSEKLNGFTFVLIKTSEFHPDYYVYNMFSLLLMMMTIDIIVLFLYAQHAIVSNIHSG